MKRRCYIKRRDSADDRHRVADELSKRPHPLGGGQGEDNVLYNIVNGKIAPHAVNVADAVSTGDNMLRCFAGRCCPASMPKCLVQ